jgi:hypothetical protein
VEKIKNKTPGKQWNILYCNLDTKRTKMHDDKRARDRQKKDNNRVN